MLGISLCACDAAEELGQKLNAKTFTEGTLTIQLTRDFLRMDILAQDFDFCVGSGDVSIFAIRLDYEELDIAGVSAWDYAQAYRAGSDRDTISEVTAVGEIPTVQYKVYDDDGDLQTVLGAFYEASDCLWFLQFVFDTEDYDELYPQVEQYVLSVTCE